MSDQERNGETPEGAPTEEQQTTSTEQAGTELPVPGYEAAAAEAASTPAEGEGAGEEPSTGGEAEKPAEGEAEKPAEGEAEKPAEGEAEKPAEGEAGKPAEGEAGKPAEGEAEKPAEGEAEKPAEGEAEKPAEGEAEKTGKAAKGVKVRRRKSLYATDVKSGQDVDGTFLVHRKTLPVDRTGRPFLAVTLIDRSGRLEARLWDEAEQVSESFREGDFVRIKGQGQSFQGRMQVRLESIETVHPSALEVPTSEFMPESKAPADRMFAEVLGLVEGIEHEQLRALVRTFLDDPEQARKLKRAPAAQSVHHAWIGGLLEHTLSVMKLAQRLCDHYPQVNRDLVLAGAFLHDIGKIDELSYDANLGYTDAGRLVGHLVMTSQWIHERGRTLGMSAPLVDQLVHIVVSHHGQYEYGSPRRPKTLEALLVHYADVIDARMSSWTELLGEAGPDGWTDYNRIYDRHLFRTDLARAPDAGKKKKRRRKKKKGEGAEAAPAERRAAKPKAERPARPARGERRAEGEEGEGRRGRRAEGEEGEGRRGRRGEPRGRKREPKAERPAAASSLTFNPFAALKKQEEGEQPAEAKPERAPEQKAAEAKPERVPEQKAAEAQPEPAPEQKPQTGETPSGEGNE